MPISSLEWILDSDEGPHGVGLFGKSNGTGN